MAMQKTIPKLKQPDKDLVSFNIQIIRTFFCSEEFTAGILRETETDKYNELDEVPFYPGHREIKPEHKFSFKGELPVSDEVFKANGKCPL